MSETFTMAMKAGPGTIYAPGAAATLIGTVTRVRLPGDRETEGVITAATVNEDGSEMEITVEVPGGTLPSLPLDSYSISS